MKDTHNRILERVPQTKWKIENKKKLGCKQNIFKPSDKHQRRTVETFEHRNKKTSNKKLCA